MRSHPFLTGIVVFCLFTIGGIGFFVVYPQLVGVYHWRQARQALEQNDFPRAHAHLQSCLEIWPSSAETSFLMARTCRRAANFDAARTHLQEAERLGWVPALVELERLLMVAQAGFVQAVEEELRRFLETRPQERKLILEALVVGSLQANFIEDAYRWSSRWAEDYPDDCQAHFMCGRVLESGLRYDLAAEEYQQALERRPDLTVARVGLAEMLVRTGRFAEALPHFQACLQIEPRHAAARLGLARCQRNLSPPEAALATLEPLFADNEGNADAFLLRGQLELARGNAEAALEWLQRAEQMSPQDLETYQALATALRLLSRNEEAQTYEAKRLESERRLRRMEELTKEIIQKPKDVGLRCEAGTTLLRLGKPQEGARWLASALLIDPHHRPTKEALAACLPKLGDAKLVEQYRHLLEE
jgi:tetratricopeptide (TPR) repeat protein